MDHSIAALHFVLAAFRSLPERRRSAVVRCCIAPSVSSSLLSGDSGIGGGDPGSESIPLQLY